MRENQAGFRKGSSCQDQIFSVNQLIERCIDQQLPCPISFIDFKAAFDSIHRPSLWQILCIYRIPSKIVDIIFDNLSSKIWGIPLQLVQDYHRCKAGRYLVPSTFWVNYWLCHKSSCRQGQKRTDASTQEKLEVLRSQASWPGLCRWHSSFRRNPCWNGKENWN